ncbi:hypothetical protein VNO80_23264 [Phaseolus coccineus]|uniref:Uncharacterized protein n=1 Tax=Phaseolus coccineus TaxID=3886 RepID=A0AAN9QSF6_PHACN
MLFGTRCKLGLFKGPSINQSSSKRHIVQGETKSLRQYMNHFAKASLSILDLYSTIAMRANKVRLRPGSFSNNLYEEKVGVFVEVIKEEEECHPSRSYNDTTSS